MNNRVVVKALIKDQTGYAAFAVTMIIMIILSLIVLGYSANSRREQRATLDNQLNSGAYYAAESGINDAYKIIQDSQRKGYKLQDQLSCTGGPYSTPISNNLNPSLNPQVSYPCLLVNLEPRSLEYRPLIAGEGEAIPVFGESSIHNPPVSSTISTITISWQDHQPISGGPNFNNCPLTSTTNSFSYYGSYNPSCAASVLQVDIVPSHSNALHPTAQSSVFLEPTQHGSAGGKANQNGSIIGIQCSNPPTIGSKYDCTAVLSSLPQDSGKSSQGYYVKITPFYQDTDLSLTAQGGSPTPNLYLYDAQALIDSTGKSSDVLKRIQERVCINIICDNNAPPAALSGTNGICKSFTAQPGIVNGYTTSCP